MNLLLRECFQLIKKFHPKIFLGDLIAVTPDQERDEYKRNFSFSNFTFLPNEWISECNFNWISCCRFAFILLSSSHFSHSTAEKPIVEVEVRKLVNFVTRGNKVFITLSIFFFFVGEKWIEFFLQKWKNDGNSLLLLNYE